MLVSPKPGRSSSSATSSRILSRVGVPGVLWCLNTAFGDDCSLMLINFCQEGRLEPDLEPDLELAFSTGLGELVVLRVGEELPLLLLLEEDTRHSGERPIRTGLWDGLGSSSASGLVLQCFRTRPLSLLVVTST